MAAQIRKAPTAVSQPPTGKASKRVEKPAYLDWIRSLPCLVTRTEPVEAAHVSFADPRAGIYLYLIHAFSAILCGILLRRKLPISLHRPHGTKKGTSPAAIFPAAVQNAFSSVWNVCGFVILFMVLLRLLSLLPGLQSLSSLPRAALYGFVEMTNGILALPASRKGFILCAALTGWGGLSVHAQTLALLRTTDLSARRYFLGKLLHALLSALMAALISCHLG